MQKLTIPNLLVFEPKLSGSEKNKITLQIDNTDNSFAYYAEPSNGDFIVDKFHHFPVLINADGSPWQHGVLYLLSKLESNQIPSPKTLESIAVDLSHFMEFISSTPPLDYLVSPKRKLQRPTYAYRAYLQELLQDGLISKNTASRRMSSVIGFYRWLEKQHDTIFEHQLWDEREVYIQFYTAEGFSKIKHLTSTNLAVKVPANNDDFSEYIIDGGRLRPLSKIEQENLIKALIEIGNPEMTLAFLIALTSGARIQTVFTLRIKHFIDININALREVPIKVGMGTGVDSKFQKNMSIFIPAWLIDKIKMYLHSERALRRRTRSNHYFESENDQYLFLTQSGAPYYISETDPQIIKYRTPQRGNAIRQFIKSQLMPILVKNNSYFAFSFHDLRATYGMNILEEKINKVEAGDYKLFDVLIFIRERLGHKSTRTTELYLNYRQKQSIALNTQSNFESYLQNLIEANFG
jgi:integrase